MEVVKRIRLLDGSEHTTKQKAERYLFDSLSSGSRLELFDQLANKSSLKVKNIFIDNYNDIVSIMRIITELRELENLKGF